MKRGELYRVPNPTAKDPKKSRVFVVVSRQILLDSSFSTVICAPIYSSHHGLSTQVAVGTEEGLKHESSIHCDELISLPKSALTNYVATLPFKKLQSLNRSLGIALELPEII
jgi:mRNA interferase MazF